MHYINGSISIYGLTTMNDFLAEKKVISIIMRSVQKQTHESDSKSSRGLTSQRVTVNMTTLDSDRVYQNNKSAMSSRAWYFSHGSV
jgi:hypothetical protein